MKRYVVAFGVVNLTLTIALAILATSLKMKSGSSFGVAAVGASAFVSGWLFFRDYDRPPSDDEKASFAWRALLTAWAVSLALAAVVLPFLISTRDFKGAVSVLLSWETGGLILGVLLFVSCIYYFTIRWAFGWYGKLTASQR